jgi:alpha-L-fucosidase
MSMIINSCEFHMIPLKIINFNHMKPKEIYRRDFVKQIAMGTAALTAGIPFLSFSCINSSRSNNSNSVKNSSFPTPTPGQIIWQDSEVGLVYHFDIAVAARRHGSRNNAHKEVFDPNEYNPQKLDTDQWIEAAIAAGAKYAVFTATHFNGFLQWQSNAYPYGLKQTKWRNGKGDILDDFVKSCHKAGIKPGIYLSTHRNAYWKLWDYYVDWGKGKGTKEQEKFNRSAEKMVEELCSRYGPLVQIWFDAGTKLPHEGGPDVLPIFDKYQPDSVFYHSTKRSDHRWIGNESGYANYPCWATMPLGDGVISHNSPWWKPILADGDPDGKIWAPGMVDVPLRAEHGIHNWFWAPDQDHAIYSKEKLIDIYYKSVGRNCNLVIGEVITPEGLVPEADIKRLKEFGDEIQNRFNNLVASGKGKGKEVILKWDGTKAINHVIIQEDIKHGERIRIYTIEALKNGNWEKICDGQSVGHKRIQQFDKITCEGIRLCVNKSTSEPLIKNLSAFHVI